MARLRSDFWVAAHLRRCAVETIPAVLRRRGSAEAGAIYVKVDHLDGTASLYGPAPQALLGDETSHRLFAPILTRVTPLDVEERMEREGRFDPDYWLIEIDSAEDRHLLDIVPNGD